MKDFAIALLKVFYALALVIGAVLVALGAAASVKFKDYAYTAQSPSVLIVFGGVLMLVGIGAYVWDRIAKPHTSLPDPKDYGVKIIQPGNGVSVEGTTDVIGTLKKPLPNGYRLQLVRRWESKPGIYYPVKIADVNQDGTHWTASKCFVGGDSGDGRILEVVLVGPDAALLFDTWKRGNEAFIGVKPDGNRALYPGIEKFPDDAIKCATVNVVRK